MKCFVGIDIGAVSVTATLLVFDADPKFTLASSTFEQITGENGDTYLSAYLRTRGKPVAAATTLIEQIIDAVGANNVKGVCLTGSGSKLVADKLGATVVNEFRAIAAGLGHLGSNVKTVFEMGGETSKYLRLTSEGNGSLGIVDYATNGDCAAGTGSFIDQQAGRLKYNVEDIGDICAATERAAQVAGRCSVFAKSDMIHAQQKGYGPAEVLRGLCNAVARNFKAAVVKSHPVEEPVAFIGGVASNSAVVDAMRETFNLDETQMIIPQAQAHLPAIGAAVIASRTEGATDLSAIGQLRSASDSTGEAMASANPLTMDNVTLLRDRVKPYTPADGDIIDVFLGIDIGSVSTNLVLIDTAGKMVEEIYTRTKGRPIEVVSDSLKQLEEDWAGRVVIRGVGTTGSGRELIGALVGADTINDEITAHKTGATFVGETMLDGRVPDTIFEIGGQDSKYISLEDGVVVDFTMNEACAAGTGSFLEERAEELDIAIKGEFADLALASNGPTRLGERCTVFMERDVNSCMQRGASKGDLVAGLAYSVVYNYINRVVRGRKIGDCIFFQGGTAYNDAVAAAFSQVCGKDIIVPPFNGVVGAIGSALLARDMMLSTSDKTKAATSTASAAKTSAKHVDGQGDQDSRDDQKNTGSYVSEASPELDVAAKSKFRGYDMSLVDYDLREFTCKGCSNACQIQQFTVEGDKTYWGDKCSDKFRKVSKSAKKPVIENLVDYRMNLLLDENHQTKADSNTPVVGIPMTMFAYDSLPFWRTLFTQMGCNVVLSDPSNKKIIQAGIDNVVAEPCFPIIVAHGHVADLGETDGVDYIFLPNIVSQETKWTDNEAYLCPWHMTLPFVIRRAPGLSHLSGKFLTPTIFMREGRQGMIRDLVKFFVHSPLGAMLKLKGKDIANAAQAAFDAQDQFRQAILDKGAIALDTLAKSGEPGIVLVGRPYNIHDAGINLSVASKLRDYYGVNCIPLDFLDTDVVDIRDTNDNMFWDLGRRIIAAAKIVGENPNLHIIYITNFKCGPDSFIKHFITAASHKPFLSLQFDGHSNDAGMMTRCEAYLDSKGILRPWRKKSTPAMSAAN